MLRFFPILLLAACSTAAPSTPGVVERFCTERSDCTLATFHTRRTAVAAWARPQAEAWLRTLPPVELEPEQDVTVCHRFQCSYVRTPGSVPQAPITPADSSALRF